MCTVLLPPGDNPIAVNKYIISYHKSVSKCGRYRQQFAEAPKRSMALVSYTNVRKLTHSIWLFLFVKKCYIEFYYESKTDGFSQR
jgi:hypothetical protein